MLETLDYTIRIGSTPTFLYFDLYIKINKLQVDLIYNLYLFPTNCWLHGNTYIFYWYTKL